MSQHHFEPLIAHIERELDSAIISTKIEGASLEVLELRDKVRTLERRLFDTQHALDQRRIHQASHKELRDEFALAIYCKGGSDWSACYVQADQGLKARLAK